jgi:2-hydroxychromene-2-carboxylate isomerase
MDHIDFWFTTGSTYTYLSVMRLGAIAKTERVTFRWRPFAGVRALTGTAPFPDGASKRVTCGAIIERRAAKYAIPLRLPVPYPSADLRLANCVAVLGMREGWGEQYVCAAYRRWFQHGEENGGEQNLWAALAECDQNFERVVAQARSEATQHDLDAKQKWPGELDCSDRQATSSDLRSFGELIASKMRSAGRSMDRPDIFAVHYGRKWPLNRHKWANFAAMHGDLTVQ